MLTTKLRGATATEREDTEMATSVKRLLSLLNYGLITIEEFHAILESREIRGTLDDSCWAFCGYDYRNQKWITIEYSN
jgi:hypothetical protein